MQPYTDYRASWEVENVMLPLDWRKWSSIGRVIFEERIIEKGLVFLLRRESHS